MTCPIISSGTSIVKCVGSDCPFFLNKQCSLAELAKKHLSQNSEK